MEAIFKKTSSSAVIWLMCGIFLIGLFAFVGFQDREATLGGTLVGIIFGVILSAFGAGGLLLNRKAYLHIKDGRIQGKYHLFGKIDCPFSDVSFATARMNTLIIQLKGGKTHTVMGIENLSFLASEIRQNMQFAITEPPKALMEKLNALKSAMKEYLIYSCVGMVLMFLNILIAVLLTGAKDLYQFSQRDWIIFAVMGGVEIITIIATFYFSHKTGTCRIPLEYLRYAIRRTVVETAPVLPGFAIGVYTDENYLGRITVFGYPHQSAVYYCVQQLDAEFNLVQMYTSDTYDSIADFPGDLESLIDITENVLR